MHNEYLMGNAAIAMGAIASGLNLIAGYPGTPSTEILENVAKRREKGTYVEWSVNEKAALELAAGASYAGARTMVTMKQVGLNVASDPLMSLEYVGIKGGMVIVVADDPGPISSQTEQDTRHFARFSKLPCFDPSSPAEAYDMVQEAFAYSEKYGTPVFLRPTTRICHAYASLTIKDKEEYIVHKPDGFVKDSKRWVIFPRLSYANHQKIIRRNEELSEIFSNYERNRIDFDNVTFQKEEKRLGIAASGISYAYAAQVLEEKGQIPLFKVGTPFPFPEKKAISFLKKVDVVLCLEELDPVIERELIYLCGKCQLKVHILGKLSHDVNDAGENSIDDIYHYIEQFMNISFEKEKMISLEENVESIVTPDCGNVLSSSFSSAKVSTKEQEDVMPALPVRPPVLCAGCPHRASFYAVKQAMKEKKTIFCGDIGCYTLGNALPLDMVDTCLCMGAGVNIAQGVYKIEPDTNCFAFVGDSTFFASAMTGVVNAVYNQARMTLIVLDNSTTAMTGHQPHPGTGHTMMGDIVEKIDITAILKGIGVKEVQTVDPMNLELSVNTVRKIADMPGVKAVIFKSPCAAIVKPHPALMIAQEKCIQCKKCIREIGCPGIIMNEGKVCIDTSLCTGCGLCAQICPVSAIGGSGNE